MKVYAGMLDWHIVYEDGVWELWRDGELVGRFRTREEAEEAIA